MAINKKNVEIFKFKILTLKYYLMYKEPIVFMLCIMYLCLQCSYILLLLFY